MAELTQEQIDRAGSILLTNWSEICGTPYKDGCIDRIRAAARILQLPWEGITEVEVAELLRDSADMRPSPRSALEWFVRRRNAVLLSNPVDPRIAIVRHQLGGASMVHDLDGVAVKILHALDGAKK